MRRRLMLSCLLLATLPASLAAETLQSAFAPVTDSLRFILDEHFHSCNDPKVKKILKKGKTVDIYFTRTLGDYAWKREDIGWFRDEIHNRWPESLRGCKLGAVYVDGKTLNMFITPELTYDGQPTEFRYRGDDRDTAQWVTRVGAPKYPRGLDGRVIALWQSHGRYFNEHTGRWMWQRAPLFRTVEDMYTQSYVLQGLIPMLENAGAYTITPRERDTCTDEVVADNDPPFERADGVLDGDADLTGETSHDSRHAAPGSRLRRRGDYAESGRWEDAGPGFADAQERYLADDNPFTMGGARMAKCVSKSGSGRSEAVWTAEFPGKERCAVYISYKTVEGSSKCASYTVRHAGGKTRFVVNQTIGGGTWVYLGTFDFDRKGSVILDNVTPDGYSHIPGSVVTADATRFGGGMGKVARGLADAPGEEELSGLPAFAEGALYSLQWAGVDTSVTKQWDDEYTREFASRGAWVRHMSEDKGVPIDLSLGFHTDAGQAKGDSTIGTLSIYTLKCDGSDKFPNGRSRWTSRTYADYVQTQVVDDIRALYDSSWTRRGLWDRSYSESRTTGVPAMLLELLSHQNFNDMRYGLDPAFRMCVSRAVYKGILKYLSQSYVVPYVVQPLPVKDLAVTMTAKGARVSWTPVHDPLEPTADPDSYILQTRVDDGTFDEGIRVRRNHADVPIEDGKLYSFRVIAVNEGGRSMPSETLCAGRPGQGAKQVLIINNFDRVAAPSWFDTQEYAGFDGIRDNGVPLGEEICYVGGQYEFDRRKPYLGNDNAGFGASGGDMAGAVIPGNSFDLVRLHARALMDAGYSVASASRDAWQRDSSLADGAFAVDLLCGKQTGTVTGRADAPVRYRVWPEELRGRVRGFAAGGGNLIVSGSYIGSDIHDGVYPFAADSSYTERSARFVRDVLGWKWVSGHERGGAARPVRNKEIDLKGSVGTIRYNSVWGPAPVYCAESADGIGGASSRASTVLRYADSGVSAAVAYDARDYKAVSIGFPLETVTDRETLTALMGQILYWFE